MWRSASRLERHAARLAGCEFKRHKQAAATLLCALSVNRHRMDSALACWTTGMSGSASLHRVRRPL
jgi:hypothetical protein